nr:phage tail protein [Escherichia coli]
MMPVSRNLCIFLNVGLGEAAKLGAAVGVTGNTGRILIPALIGGV